MIEHRGACGAKTALLRAPPAPSTRVSWAGTRSVEYNSVQHPIRNAAKYRGETGFTAALR